MMEFSDAQRVWRSELERQAVQCAIVLKEARRLVAASSFGPMLGRSLGRACDLLDQVDKVLIALQPRRDYEAFVRVAALHRELEEIQSLVPRARRSFQHGVADGPLHAADLVERSLKLGSTERFDS